MNGLKKLTCIGALALALSSGCEARKLESDHTKQLGRDKILTCSVEDYCKSVGKLPSDYDLIGVSGTKIHAFGGGYCYFNDCIDKQLAPATEVIVDLKVVVGSQMYYYGTALVPKDRK